MSTRAAENLSCLAFLRIGGTLKNDEIGDNALLFSTSPCRGEGLVGFEDAPNDLLEDVTLLVRPTTFVAPVGVVRAMVGDTPGGVATLIVIVPVGVVRA